MERTWLGRIANRLTVKRQVQPRAADHRAELQALVTKAWNLRRLGNLEGAQIVLDQAIALAPGDPETYYTRGLVRCAAKRYDDAIADLDRALELRPQYPEALTERGLAYVNRGALTRGIADYDAALQIDPAYATALDNKGSALCLRQLWTHALPLLDRALRLAPTSVNARHNRSVAHQLLGDPARALVDLERLAELAGDGAQRLAAQRLARLRALVGAQPHAWSVADELWPEHVTLSLDHCVAELLSALRTHDAYHVVLPLAGGGHAVVPVYEASGLRVRLTEIADLLGPAILTLQLGQLLGPLTPCTRIDRTATHDEAMQAVQQGGGRTLVVEGDQILGVLETGTDYGRPQLPTTLFGPRPRFDRSAGRISRAARRTPERAPPRADGDASRTCAGCALEVAYYHPTLVDDQLTSIACPRCGRDPIPDWIEERMRPGAWSRAGFLDASERVRDVIERDARTLGALGLTHAEIAAALDRLLCRASTEDEPRIARAVLRFHERMIEAGLEAASQPELHAGAEWLDGARQLELAPSLDDLVRQLRRGELPPDSQGVVIDGMQVFFKVYLGYQACPWTMLRRPYCAAEPPWPMQTCSAGSVRVRAPVLGAALPCTGDVTFRHGDRDFLVIDRRTRTYLRGSGLLPHLIGAHHFFGGAHSPYRLDPERAARVLRLIGP